MDNNSLVSRQEEIEEIVKNGGFYGNNGVWNSIIRFSGDNRLYRERVETIVVRNRKEVFLKKKPNGEYFLPGGSTEKDLPDIQQAINECREEAHINVRKIESTGITYKKSHKAPLMVKNKGMIEWQGTVTTIYVAEYDGMFHGNIDKEDRDPFILSGKWYSTKECFKIFEKHHRDALLQYLKNTEITNDENALTTESYFTNYFKNLKLLRKINNRPEVSRQALIDVIKIMTKKYNSMKSKENIKKLKRTDEVKISFFPCCNYIFDDNSQVVFAVSFDDSEYSDGAAFKSNKFGDVVVVYPRFFKDSEETQIFILLHELGHIRLNHINPKNSRFDLFGNTSIEDYRIRKMRKGRAMYTEINADLYAILQGGSMYEILGLKEDKDIDKDYDYRFTNAELSNRYSEVFRKYMKMSKHRHTLAMESKYDILDSAIDKYIFENNNLYFLSDSEKCELSEIIYEYTINSKIKMDENIHKLSKLFNLQIRSINEKLNYIIENGILDKDLLDVRAENFVICESYTVPPIVIHGMINSLENTYEKLYEKNVEVFENCYEKIENFNDAKGIILDTSRKLLDRLKLKKESIDDERIDHYIYILESLSKSDRAKIPESKFGIPETRSYPLDTKKHVRSAIILFGKSDKRYRKELAERIFQAMDEFNISYDMIGPKSSLYPYIPEDKLN